ncbi:MAG: permease prefix domain 1-containing protein [Candidatus Marinimicrobia bacterium]|nr:permease prefix domain 1-containing protein [Candidatus Neomarinimicrobiota bacterium]
MDAIKSYLDNVFANLPKTDAVLKAKAEMMANMEEKYLHFKKDGLSEHEAVGRVIAEFGSIDELLAELNVAPASSTPGTASSKARQVSREEAVEYVNQKRQSGILIGLGVFMCIAGVAALILINQIGFMGHGHGQFAHAQARPVLGVVVLLLMVAAAVGIFIYAGMRLSKFEFLEGDFTLPAHLQKEIEDKKDAFTPSFTVAIIIGVSLCILAPLLILLPFLLTGPGVLAPYWVVAMLLTVATAVFVFVYAGSIKEAYDKLLKTGDYSRQPDQKFTNAVSSVIWPLAIMSYLLLGFLGDYWGKAWIIFPVAVFLSIAISAIAKFVRKE